MSSGTGGKAAIILQSRTSGTLLQHALSLAVGLISYRVGTQTGDIISNTNSSKPHKCAIIFKHEVEVLITFLREDGAPSPLSVYQCCRRTYATHDMGLIYTQVDRILSSYCSLLLISS